MKIKIKTVYWVLMFIFFSQNILAQESYFYNNGDTLKIDYLKNKKFIITNISDTFLLKNELEINDLKINQFGDFNRIDFSYLYNLNDSLLESDYFIEQYWYIIENDSLVNVDFKSNDNIFFITDYIEIKNTQKQFGIPNSINIKVKDYNQVNLLNELSDSIGFKIIGNLKNNEQWYSILLEKNLDVLSTANFISENFDFEFVDIDFIGSTEFYCNNDQYYNQQWALENNGQNNGVAGVDINYCNVKQITNGDESITVTVLDNGIQLNHPDITNINPLSINLSDGSQSIVYDPHGTAIGGIIGASIDNNIGVSGISPNSSLISLSVFSFSAGQVTNSIGNGIEYAYVNGTDIINCSWGNESNFVKEKIENATLYGRKGLGSVVVCATGNDDNGPLDTAPFNPISKPASYSFTIAVGAISQCGERKSSNSCDGAVDWGSNYGNALDVVAPGVLIPTTDLTTDFDFNDNSISYSTNTQPYDSNSDYHLSFDGTSAAAPHVSGLAALILSVNPYLCHEQVKQIICETAQKIRPDLYNYQTLPNKPYGPWHEEVGYGLIDAEAAVTIAQQMAEDIQESNACCESSFIYDANDYEVDEPSQTLVWDENTTKPFYDGNTAYIDGTLTIKENTTLTIRNQTLNFSKIGKIVVEKGAILNIDNCVLTSTCNTMWQGIQVEGLSGGLPSQQGILTINDSHISKAFNGVSNAIMSTMDNYQRNSSGGRITAVNNVFENNRRDIALFPYNGLFSNNSIINLNEFKTTQAIAGNIDHVEHILIETNRATITNNTFAPDPGFEYTRSGIRSASGIATIRGNTFTEMNYGVYGFSMSQFNTLTISNNDFSCRVGAYLNNLVYAKIEENNFTVGQTNLPPNVIQGCIGLELDNCTRYSVQENEFNGQFSNQLTNIGLNVYNSNNNIYSNDNNEIYKNFFNDLLLGTVASGENRNSLFDSGDVGLEYKCNEFTNTSLTDIGVLGLNINEGIKTYQGFPTTALGSTRSNNQFTRPVTTNRNIGVFGLTNHHYFFHDDGYQGGVEVYPTEPLNNGNA